MCTSHDSKTITMSANQSVIHYANKPARNNYNKDITQGPTENECKIEWKLIKWLTWNKPLLSLNTGRRAYFLKLLRLTPKCQRINLHGLLLDMWLLQTGQHFYILYNITIEKKILLWMDGRMQTGFIRSTQSRSQPNLYQGNSNKASLHTPRVSFISNSHLCQGNSNKASLHTPSVGFICKTHLCQGNSNKASLHLVLVSSAIVTCVKVIVNDAISITIKWCITNTSRHRQTCTHTIKKKQAPKFLS